MRLQRGLVATLSLFLVLVICGSLLSACSDDDGDDPKGPDAAADAGADVEISPDTRSVDDPFGRECANLGEPCKDPDPIGFDLVCVALNGGTEGKGYCTRSCSNVGNECYEAANGQSAGCLIDGQGGEKFCAFICKAGALSWACPPAMTCGEPQGDSKVAICLP